MDANEKRFKILLVEDDVLFIRTILMYLGPQYKIETAKSLNDARAIIAKLKSKKLEHFDCYLLDRTVSDGSCVDLIPSLREDFPSAGIIVVSGDGDYQSIRESIQVGAHDYVVKGDNTIPDLLIRIPEVIARAKKDLVRESNPAFNTDYKSFLLNAEKSFFEKALEMNEGRVGSLPEKLGLSRSTIFKKINEFGLNKKTKREIYD